MKNNLKINEYCYWSSKSNLVAKYLIANAGYNTEEQKIQTGAFLIGSRNYGPQAGVSKLGGDFIFFFFFFKKKTRASNQTKDSKIAS